MELDLAVDVLDDLRHDVGDGRQRVRRIRRVLRAGGVLQVADIANGRPVPIEAMRDVDLWTVPRRASFGNGSGVGVPERADSIVDSDECCVGRRAGRQWSVVAVLVGAARWPGSVCPG